MKPGQSKPIFESIRKFKEIFIEPKNNKDLKDCIDRYEDLLANGPRPENYSNPKDMVIIFIKVEFTNCSRRMVPLSSLFAEAVSRKV